MRELLRRLLIECLAGILGRELTPAQVVLIDRQLDTQLLEDVFDADELGIDPEDRFDA